ncbi:gamma-glutamylcyclotransferase family protein [Halomonas getboli]|uniref:gamma-glutamylcyclotransferase family protein n=1 Tax=Halomonas getboli TaxID=2935862 RepID=UPI001FFF47B9|nr:gamma-glutamylcyclotransferase family protein [Halomonas getboli]MCK2183150.1 gamma-glutamylcyclotransferase [Halomonas getboli]
MPSPRLLIGLPLLATPLAVAAWLWLTMLSPWTYERPAHLAPIAEGSHALFVYGTLTHAPIRWVAYGRTGDPEPATLDGYRRTGLDLAPCSGCAVKGLRLTVSAEELARLDRYEHLGIRYRRDRVELADGRSAWVYRRLDDED